MTARKTRTIAEELHAIKARVDAQLLRMIKKRTQTSNAHARRMWSEAELFASQAWQNLHSAAQKVASLELHE